MQKVALIGAGTMGRTHAAAYVKMPGAQLVAVCDERAEAADAAAESYSCAAYYKIETLLAEAEADVIDVCTPTPSHLDVIKKAAAAGRNVICEKPLARTTGQAMEAVRVCKEAGVRLFVAHVLRWFPEFRKLHDLVCSGAVGDVAMVRTARCGGSPPGWFADPKLSGGVVLDLIIHDFDWLRWTFGAAQRVYALGLSDAAKTGKDHALVTIRFENGVIAHVEGSWSRPGGFETSVEIAGSAGLLSFSSSESAPLTMQIKSPEGEQTGVTVPESPTGTDPYYRELEHFIGCLENGAEPEVTAEDGMEAVRLAEGALRSIATDRPVVLV